MRARRTKSTGLALVAAGLAGAAAWRANRRRAFTFTGRSVVITGGSRGLGLVLARQLAAQGARLTLIARNAHDLQSAADAVHARHPETEVLVVSADVGERVAVKRAVSTTIERYGAIDVLINNAGIIQVGPMDHMEQSDYDDAMRTHFWGPLFMTLESLPYMRNQRGGRIVNISSVGGRISVPHLLPYCASKFALAGLSEGLRAELARDHIVVTSVYPGLMRTGSAVNASFKGRHAQEYTWFAVASSLPLMTIDAERAARKILDASRRGDAELVITPQAKAAILARTLAPGLFSDVMSLASHFLPGVAGPEGNVATAGRSTESKWSQSPVLTPLYAAAHKNNEL